VQQFSFSSRQASDKVACREQKSLRVVEVILNGHTPTLPHCAESKFVNVITSRRIVASKIVLVDLSGAGGQFPAARRAANGTRTACVTDRRTRGAMSPNRCWHLVIRLSHLALGRELISSPLTAQWTRHVYETRKHGV